MTFPIVCFCLLQPLVLKCLCVSVFVSAGRCSLLPVVNNSGAICNSWKLDPTTLRFPLKGMLPFDKVGFWPVHMLKVCWGMCLLWFRSIIPLVILQDLFEPQTGLLRYVLEQPYSREMVCNMLGLNKQVWLTLHQCCSSASLFSASPVFAPALPLFHLTVCHTSHFAWLYPHCLFSHVPYLPLLHITLCLLTSMCHLTPSFIVSALLMSIYWFFIPLNSFELSLSFSSTFQFHFLCFLCVVTPPLSCCSSSTATICKTICEKKNMAIVWAGPIMHLK